jgi:hypothetical protein
MLAAKKNRSIAMPNQVSRALLAVDWRPRAVR